MFRRPAVVVLVLALAVVACRAEETKPFLHPLFTDHAVLQRDMDLPVWGWTAPDAKVKVSMAGQDVEATAGADGRWQVKLKALSAGGPYEMKVSGPQDVTVKDLLIGDVWICSGQSNMQWGLAGSNNAQEEIAKADYPQIRLFTVPNIPKMEPVDFIQANWVPCSPQTAGGFSAVGYFFGRHLYNELKIPIGLVHTSWGGTRAEAWTSFEALEKHLPAVKPELDTLADFREKLKAGNLDYEKELEAWWKKADKGAAQNWADPAFQTADWKSMDIPQNWESAGVGLDQFDGLVWFRKEFEVPADWAGKDLQLALGPIDDIDTTYFNGTKVGSIDRWNDPRNYKVPGALVKAGKNVIAVRVLDTGGGGGMHGNADQYKLKLGDQAIDLNGAWSFQVSGALNEIGRPPQKMDNNPNTVTVLYNGMIAPLLPAAIKGAIWYQGESNAGDPERYQVLLPTMIQDWRDRFGCGDFSFLIVLLANFMGQDAQPQDRGWQNLREAQIMATEKLPKVGLGSAIDIGDAQDIHPRNKQDVGKRLGLAAQAIAYGQKVVYSGPVYKAMKVDGDKAVLSFDHIGSGLEVKGDKLTGFALCGEDKKFVWAEARVDGDTVVVSSPDVAKPVAVRYAWANNPVCNLYNKEGLPAVPFRTDRPE